MDFQRITRPIERKIAALIMRLKHRLGRVSRERIVRGIEEALEMSMILEMTLLLETGEKRPVPAVLMPDEMNIYGPITVALNGPNWSPEAKMTLLEVLTGEWHIELGTHICGPDSNGNVEIPTSRKGVSIYRHYSSEPGVGAVYSIGSSGYKPG